MGDRIQEPREGREWLGHVKATGINYITWRSMFNATEALDKYDLDMGAGECKVRADNYFHPGTRFEYFEVVTQ
jgi:hypothetical protein